MDNLYLDEITRIIKTRFAGNISDAFKYSKDAIMPSDFLNSQQLVLPLTTEAKLLFDKNLAAYIYRVSISDPKHGVLSCKKIFSNLNVNLIDQTQILHVITEEIRYELTIALIRKTLEEVTGEKHD